MAAKPKRRVYAYRCPKCGSETFTTGDVKAKARFFVTGHGVVTQLAEITERKFNLDRAKLECVACSYEGKSADFRRIVG